MKKRTIKLAALSLMMTAMLFNCKDKDEDPTAPPTEITEALNAITLPAQTLDKPAEVKSTAASVEASAKATEVNGALGNIGSTGVVPASVATAASDVKAALSDSDINTLKSVNAETINAVKAGGDLSPELQAVIEKAMANPALAAYFPKFTFPTVNGVAVRGAKGKRVATDVTASNARTTGTDAVEKVEAIAVDDACITAANSLFNTAKTRLDASKATEDAKVAAQYAADIAPIANQQTTCTDGLTATYAGYRATTEQTANAALAALNSAQAVLGAQYDLLVVLVNAQILQGYSTINELEAADKQACIAKAAAATTNAQAVRESNGAKVNQAYTAALAEATKLQGEAIRSCHNQGGGN